jgi:hypothetical protein
MIGSMERVQNGVIHFMDLKTMLNLDQLSVSLLHSIFLCTYCNQGWVLALLCTILNFILLVLIAFGEGRLQKRTLIPYSSIK